mmetsp:Transcript_40737/g.86746  ORF Transcript_40737/g.86746 Transcript_40737/m.86746 type:complete len:259 (+) Transcript_40737:279-1055(+)
MNHEATIARGAQLCAIPFELTTGNIIHIKSVILKQLQSLPDGHMAMARARHNDEEAWRSCGCASQGDAAFRVAAGKNLRHHCAAIAVLSQGQDLAPQGFCEAPLLMCLAEVHDMLYHIIAVGVCGKYRRLGDNVLDEAPHLRGLATLEQPLENATTEAVPGGLGGAPRAALYDFVNDELGRLSRHGRDALLHHVIGMGATQSLPYVAAQLHGDGIAFLIAARLIQSGLDLPASHGVSGARPDTAQNRPRRTITGGDCW